MKYANDSIWNSLNIIKYNYYKPLCFQLFGQTENSNTWPLIGKLFIPLMNYLKMNETHKIGFSVFNIASFVVSFIILYIVINICNIIYN
jgi:hypothetical protein